MRGGAVRLVALVAGGWEVCPWWCCCRTPLVEVVLCRGGLRGGWFGGSWVRWRGGAACGALASVEPAGLGRGGSSWRRVGPLLSGVRVGSGSGARPAPPVCRGLGEGGVAVGVFIGWGLCASCSLFRGFLVRL